MKTGFFLEKEEIQKDYPLRDIGFEFMENKFVYDYSNIEQAETDNLYGFLHGYCDVFARILCEMLPGSRLEFLYDDENAKSLTHAYVVLDDKFIDIRGINTDWDEFIEEFDDWIPCHDRSELTILPSLSKSDGNGVPYDPNLDKAIADIISALPGYYGLKKAA